MTNKRVEIREKIEKGNGQMFKKWYSVNDIYSKLYGSEVKLPTSHKNYTVEQPKHFMITQDNYFKATGLAMVCDLKGLGLYLNDMKLPNFADTYNAVFNEYSSAIKVEDKLMKELLEMSSYEKNGNIYIKMVALSRIVTGTDVNMKRVLDKHSNIKTVFEKYPIRNNFSVYLRNMEFVNINDLPKLRKHLSTDKKETVNYLIELFKTVKIKPLATLQKTITISEREIVAKEKPVTIKPNGLLGELRSYIQNLKKENEALKTQLNQCNCNGIEQENVQLKKEINRYKEVIGEIMQN